MNNDDKKNVILDATILTALMTCGEFFNLRFNLHLESNSGKSNSLEAGNIVHKFLEVYNLNIIKGVRRDRAIEFGMAAAETYIHGCRYCTGFVPTHFDGEGQPVESHTICTPSCVLKPPCGHQVDEYEGVRNTQPDDDGYKIGWKRVLQTIEQYNEYYRNDSWVPLEVEVVKTKLIYEDDEIRILWKSKLDMMVDTNEGIYPSDHKTFKQNRPNRKQGNQFKGQCVVTGSRKVIVNKIGFQKTLEPKDKFSRPIVSYTPERLMEWQSKTVPFWAKMLLMYHETGYWPMQENSCEGKFGPCPFIEICESDPEMRQEELRNNFKIIKAWDPKSTVMTEDE